MTYSNCLAKRLIDAWNDEPERYHSGLKRGYPGWAVVYVKNLSNPFREYDVLYTGLSREETNYRADYLNGELRLNALITVLKESGQEVQDHVSTLNGYCDLDSYYSVLNAVLTEGKLTDD